MDFCNVLFWTKSVCTVDFFISSLKLQLLFSWTTTMVSVTYFLYDHWDNYIQCELMDEQVSWLVFKSLTNDCKFCLIFRRYDLQTWHGVIIPCSWKKKYMTHLCSSAKEVCALWLLLVDMTLYKWMIHIYLPSIIGAIVILSINSSEVNNGWAGNGHIYNRLWVYAVW